MDALKDSNGVFARARLRRLGLGLRLGMGRRLGMTVIAEGAETHEQVEFLREKQCHQVQGYYYSPAIPLQQLPRLVKDLRQKRRDIVLS